jgi:activator of HSP90 ATPase
MQIKPGLLFTRTLISRLRPIVFMEFCLIPSSSALFSGESATISPEAGGAFTFFEGKIEGRNVELVPDQRIVQAWRPSYWKPGVYTLVKFELTGQAGQTRVVLDHTGFPEGYFASLNSGWKEHYWERLMKYLAKD